MDKFKNTLEKQKIKPRKKQINAVQEGSKIDISPALLGQVRIGSLKSNLWIPKICKELDARGVKYDAKTKLNQLKDLILMDE